MLPLCQTHTASKCNVHLPYRCRSWWQVLAGMIYWKNNWLMFCRCVSECVQYTCARVESEWSDYTGVCTMTRCQLVSTHCWDPSLLLINYNFPKASCLLSLWVNREVTSDEAVCRIPEHTHFVPRFTLCIWHFNIHYNAQAYGWLPVGLIPEKSTCSLTFFLYCIKSA